MKSFKENERLKGTDHASLALQFHKEHLGEQPAVNSMGIQQ